MNRKRLAVLLAILLVTGAAVTAWSHGRSRTGPALVDQASLESEIAGLSREVKQLSVESSRLSSDFTRFGHGLRIVVDTAQNRLYLLEGSEVLLEAPCSTGSGLSLDDPVVSRSWIFKTPRGEFRVLSKLTNPVWRKPDWAFIELGERPPDNPSSRFEAGVLGEYALAFGDGYFIHGTLYTRLLGRNVTHGCIRLGDEDLERLVRQARVGTPILII